MTVAEVAATVRLSTAAVYREVRRGHLEAHSVCGRLRITPEARTKWLADRTVPAPSTREVPRPPVQRPIGERGLLGPLLDQQRQ